MEGFHNVLRRITMATFAFGLTFGIPNFTFAQTPQPQTPRLPWQTSTFSTNTVPFDNDWKHVVSDTLVLLRRFAALNQFQDVLTIDETVRTETSRTLWVPNIRPNVPPTRNAPSINTETIRATFAPVEFTSGVAAESRTLSGVLVGVKFEVVD